MTTRKKPDVAWCLTDRYDVSKIIFAETADAAWRDNAWTSGDMCMDSECTLEKCRRCCDCDADCDVERAPDFDKYVYSDEIPLEAYRAAGWRWYCEVCEFEGCDDWEPYEGRAVCTDCIEDLEAKKAKGGQSESTS